MRGVEVVGWSCVGAHVRVAVVVYRDADQLVEVHDQAVHHGDGVAEFFRMPVEGFVQSQQELGVDAVEHDRLGLGLRAGSEVRHPGVGNHRPHAVRIEADLRPGEIKRRSTAFLKTKHSIGVLVTPTNFKNLLPW